MTWFTTKKVTLSTLINSVNSATNDMNFDQLSRELLSVISNNILFKLSQITVTLPRKTILDKQATISLKKWRFGGKRATKSTSLGTHTEAQVCHWSHWFWFYFFCVFSCFVLSDVKNSHIFQHIKRSETCKALCSEGCFSILDTASTSFQLKIKEALHIGWEKPLLNKSMTSIYHFHFNCPCYFHFFQFFFAFSTPMYFSYSYSCCYLVINILCTLYLYHTD